MTITLEQLDARREELTRIVGNDLLTPEMSNLAQDGLRKLKLEYDAYFASQEALKKADEEPKVVICWGDKDVLTDTDRSNINAAVKLFSGIDARRITIVVDNG